MVTIMNDKQIKTLDDIRSFLTGTAEVEFSIEDKAERYRWIQATLVRYHYMTLGKKDRGLVLRFLQRVSGYSQAQIKRLVRQFVRNGTIKRSQRTVAKFQALVYRCRCSALGPDRCATWPTLRSGHQKDLRADVPRSRRDPL